MRNNEREPIALQALKVPYQIFLFILKVYSGIIFLPFKLVSGLARGFLFHNEFTKGSSHFYIRYGLLRGLLAVCVSLSWLLAVSSPLFVLKAIDHFLLHRYGIVEDKESILMSWIVTFAFVTILAAYDLKSEHKSKGETVLILKLCWYLVEDLLSLVLIISTFLMCFNADKIRKGDFDGPERKYLRYIMFLFSLSLLDWCIFLFRLVLKVYPVRKYEHQLLMIKYEDHPFKQKMVTIQEGLYTLREIACLPMNIPIFFCSNMVLRFPFIRSMNELSHKKIFARIKLFMKAMFFFLMVVVAVILNGVLVHLSVGLYSKLRRVELTANTSEDNRYNESIKVVRRVVLEYVKSAFGKCLLVFILFPNRIKLIMHDLEKYKHQDINSLNWFSWIVGEVYLERNGEITASFILNKYWNEIMEDALANVCLFFSIIFNPVTFIQLCVLCLKASNQKSPLTPEKLKQINNEIISVYPLIFFDILFIVCFIILFILSLPFISRNMPLFNTFLFKSQESLISNSKLEKPREVFFANIFRMNVIMLDLLLVDLKMLMIILFFIFFQEHRTPILEARNTNWFETSKRRGLYLGIVTYITEFYTTIRIKFIREEKYVRYFSQVERQAERNTELSLEGTNLEIYTRKVKRGFFQARQGLQKQILRSRFRQKVAGFIRSSFSWVGLARKFTVSDQIIKDNKELYNNPEINYTLLLEADEKYSSQVWSEFKDIFVKLLFKIISLTLLWRLPTFMMLLQNGPLQNPDPEYKKDIKLVLRLMRFCYKLLLLDITHQWIFSLILLVSPADNTYVAHKYQSLILDANPLTEKMVYDQFSEFYIYKKQYVVYVVDDLLTYVISGLCTVLTYRKQIFLRIKLLVTLPQLENMNARNVNTLVLSILFKDALMFSFVAFPLLIISPLRLISFLLYVKEGFFARDIQVEVRYSKFESATSISSNLDEKRKLLKKKIVDGFKTDLYLASGVLIAIINPTKMYFINYLYKKLRIKSLQKQKRQGREFFDQALAEDLVAEVRQMWSTLGEDFMCLMSLFIILLGVYEVKASWERVGKLLRFYYRQSELYRYLNRPKKEATVDKKEDGIFLDRVGWVNMVELGDFLTMKDKLVLCTLNKRSRSFYMNTPFIWINYYRLTVNPTVKEIDESMTIGIECINYYRRELAEINDSELDFKLGIRFVLKEEAIKSVITLPQLVSSPYHLLFKLRDVLAKKDINISVSDYLRIHFEEAGAEYTAYANAQGVDRINYRAKLRFNQPPLTTDSVPDDFKSRMKGFEVLEYVFYRMGFFFANIGAIVYGQMIWTVNYSPRGIFELIRELMKSFLHIIFVGVVLGAAYYLFRFYYAVIGMDFIHSLLGPLGIHILFGILFANIQLHPYYAEKRFNPFGFFLIMKNVSFTVGGYVGKPLYKYLKKFFDFFINRLFDGIKESIEYIKENIKWIVKKSWWVYTLGVAIPTRLLVGRGVILELVHLLIVLVWICWPGYYSYTLGGIRNMLLGFLVCLAQLGVAIKAIRENSGR